MGSGVGPAEADVAEFAGDAQPDAAGFVDLVRGGVDGGCRFGPECSGGFGSGGVGSHGCGVVRQGSMGSADVVVGDELLEAGLQLIEVAGWVGWAASSSSAGSVRLCRRYRADCTYAAT